MKTIPDVTKKTLQGEVRANVEGGSNLYTDEFASYNGLEEEFDHRRVDHKVEYVRDDIYTNGLEGAWSWLKRTLRGTYVQVSPKHLPRYLNEQEFRYNTKFIKEGDRFLVAARKIGTSERLTYKELIRDEDEGKQKGKAGGK